MFYLMFLLIQVYFRMSAIFMVGGFTSKFFVNDCYFVIVKPKCSSNFYHSECYFALLQQRTVEIFAKSSIYDENIADIVKMLH